MYQSSIDENRAMGPGEPVRIEDRGERLVVVDRANRAFGMPPRELEAEIRNVVSGGYRAMVVRNEGVPVVRVAFRPVATLSVVPKAKPYAADGAAGEEGRRPTKGRKPTKRVSKSKSIGKKIAIGVAAVVAVIAIAFALLCIAALADGYQVSFGQLTLTVPWNWSVTTEEDYSTTISNEDGSCVVVMRGYVNISITSIEEFVATFEAKEGGDVVLYTEAQYTIDEALVARYEYRVEDWSEGTSGEGLVEIVCSGEYFYVVTVMSAEGDFEGQHERTAKKILNSIQMSSTTTPSFLATEGDEEEDEWVELSYEAVSVEVPSSWYTTEYGSAFVNDEEYGHIKVTIVTSLPYMMLSDDFTVFDFMSDIGIYIDQGTAETTEYGIRYEFTQAEWDDDQAGEGLIEIIYFEDNAQLVYVSTAQGEFESVRELAEEILDSIQVDGEVISTSAQSASSESSEEAEEDEEAEEQSQAAEEEASSVVYSAGSYLVGTDIPAGEYKITCVSSTKAYYCVYSDVSQDEILDNDNFSECAYIEVSDGQLLEVKRGGVRCR